MEGEWGKGGGRKRVIFLYFYVAQSLSKLVCIPESAKTSLPHSFSDLSDTIVSSIVQKSKDLI